MPEVQQITRPHSRLMTSELSALVEANSLDRIVLVSVFCELLYRDRRAAKELRGRIVEHLRRVRESFPWPSTDAPGSSQPLDARFIPYERGLLGYLGYRVGSTGVSSDQREDLLDFIFANTLPNVNDAQYMSGWGTPGSAVRLRKMAESIASFVRNAKRNPRGSTAAVHDWEFDLHYLKREYYVGNFDFPWPPVTL